MKNVLFLIGIVITNYCSAQEKASPEEIARLESKLDNAGIKYQRDERGVIIKEFGEPIYIFYKTTKFDDADFFEVYGHAKDYSKGRVRGELARKILLINSTFKFGGIQLTEYEKDESINVLIYVPTSANERDLKGVVKYVSSMTEDLYNSLK